MNTNSKIKMGQTPDAWREGKTKEITFSVTEECNLACKYCYMKGKNSKSKMNFETAKKAVDYILSNRELFNEEAIVWDFVGGEPFLEITLIDKISDYIKLQMYITDHPWFNKYRFSFASNGLLYDTPKVQKYIKKNLGHVSIGLSIDGNKIKHDLQRIKLDGSGSYDDVLKNVPLWLEQFPEGTTKATFAHADLPYLKDSIISLWNIGIKMVMANVIFEDEWQDGDDNIFEEQLRELADYTIENKLCEEYSVRFFAPQIGFPLTDEALKRNFCGAGNMLAIDYKGNYFPCLRFLDFTLNNKKGVCIGNVDIGINTDKIRPFLALTVETQSKEECKTCEVASGCAWCTGFNYDAADTNTIYQRATFICKMHKANVRASEYFWDKFTKVTGIISPREQYRPSLEEKFLQFIMNDGITPHCTYRNTKDTKNVMSKKLFDEGMKFASENGFTPVFLGDSEGDVSEGVNIISSKCDEIPENSIVICDNDINVPEGFEGNYILLVSINNIHNLSDFIKKLYPSALRINVILEGIEEWNSAEIETYSVQLDAVKDFIIDTYVSLKPLEVNILTDRLNLDSMSNCDAGNSTFSLAPNGKLYLCPAFYFDNEESYIGDLENGPNIKNGQLLEINNAPICSLCDAYHCRRCKYLNQKLTNELNTPSHIQCKISHIERNKTKELQVVLVNKKLMPAMNIIPEIDYLDPFDTITK
ncbi:radical SAM peptide maturase, CXXX-repeat target family [Clostridium tagluense]|uniref:radical SAM peptide maturase, CXXX-repeat target family n=1 Tax=Clostridium tagluense TaxID=360422 RepID=UPI001C0C3D44|nr:radical SAM peptide maturase, CXXX-repeat target family [Clostridium tagluense]MBU3130690.1 radical SAM peptide maturase, CXXX-repeat target family [Clostridium tagluense]